MVWIVNLVSAVALTALTGSVLFVFWYLLGRLLDRMGYLDVLYYLLRAMGLFFLIPFAFILLNYLGNYEDWFGGVLFWYTPVIVVVFRWLFVVWLLGVAISVFRWFVAKVRIGTSLKTGNVCGETERELFYYLCQKMNIPKNAVQLYRSYQVQVPCICGIRRPKVFLPEQEFTREELEVIFAHELTHYQQKDLWIQLTSVLLVTDNKRDEIVI